MAPDDAALRVAYLTHAAQPSGAEIALERLIDALGDRVRASVVLFEPGPMEDRLRRVGADVYVLALPRRVQDLRREEAGTAGAKAVAASMTQALRLVKLLRLLRADLVHANSLKSGVIGGLAARLARRPMVWHIHDRLAPDYMDAKAVRPMQLLVRRLPRAVIANSQATLETLPGAPGPTVIPNPLDVRGITYAAPSRDGPVTRFGMVGRFAPWKGQEQFLQAFASAFPDGNERAIFIGTALFGEEAYEASVHSLARKLGVSERVEFRGYCADVFHELRTLDVLVHASTIPEPFGQVVVEASAVGVPVLASAGGGAVELLRDGEDALLHRPGDIAQLASHLRQIAGDPETRVRLAAQNHRGLGRFAPDEVARQVLDVYRKLTR